MNISLPCFLLFLFLSSSEALAWNTNFSLVWLKDADEQTLPRDDYFFAGFFIGPERLYIDFCHYRFVYGEEDDVLTDEEKNEFDDRLKTLELRNCYHLENKLLYGTILGSAKQRNQSYYGIIKLDWGAVDDTCLVSPELQVSYRPSVIDEVEGSGKSGKSGNNDVCDEVDHPEGVFSSGILKIPERNRLLIRNAASCVANTGKWCVEEEYTFSYMKLWSQNTPHSDGVLCTASAEPEEACVYDRLEKSCFCMNSGRTAFQRVNPFLVVVSIPSRYHWVNHEEMERSDTNNIEAFTVRRPYVPGETQDLSFQERKGDDAQVICACDSAGLQLGVSYVGQNRSDLNQALKEHRCYYPMSNKIGNCSSDYFLVSIINENSPVSHKTESDSAWSAGEIFAAVAGAMIMTGLAGFGIVKFWCKKRLDPHSIEVQTVSDTVKLLQHGTKRYEDTPL